jgi:hypothetical protein
MWPVVAAEVVVDVVAGGHLQHPPMNRIIARRDRLRVFIMVERLV